MAVSTIKKTDVGIRKASYTVTTDANGVKNVVSQAGIIPIGYIAPNNVILEFFRANAYWYIRAIKDNGSVWASTEITFQMIYLNEAFV